LGLSELYRIVETYMGEQVLLVLLRVNLMGRAFVPENSRRTDLKIWKTLEEGI